MPEQEYLYSRLACDPDLGGIVDLFVEEMPGRAAALLAHLNSGDWEGVRRTAHQLKGAAGSYGFDPISPCAGQVESSIRDGRPEDEIRALVDELIAMCHRTRCGTGTEEERRAQGEGRREIGRHAP